RAVFRMWPSSWVSSPSRSAQFLTYAHGPAPGKAHPGWSLPNNREHDAHVEATIGRTTVPGSTSSNGSERHEHGSPGDQDLRASIFPSFAAAAELEGITRAASSSHDCCHN